jgi:hypothetical protein
METASDSSSNGPAMTEGRLPGTIVGNQGQVIQLSGVDLHGISAESAKKAQMVKIWTRLALVSDESLFHKIVPTLANIIEHRAREAGSNVRISRAETVLLVIKEDDTAELWVDAAAVSVTCRMKRSVQAGEAIFERDIADVTGMAFPCVKFLSTDRVVCLFREDWRFGFYMDFNPKKQLDIAAFSSTLGTLYRTLKYRHLYDALANEKISKELLDAGWFPFVEVISSEFKDLITCCEAGFDLAEAEGELLSKFDEARLESIMNRWLGKPHFSSRASLLRAAIKSFKEGEPIAVIKILLTEIEGILNAAHKTAKGRGAKLNELLKFAVASGEGKAGRPDTLFFSSAFALYLTTKTFANFDPVAEDGTAGSRHAVGHGAAKADTYTMTRALQAILTLDQLAFFT